MSADACILALDQGTSSSRALVLGSDGSIRSMARISVRSRYPREGWVEQDAMEVWQGQLEVARRALAEAAVGPAQLAGIGLTNQRETTVVWERSSGKPVAPAIVWQDRRTADFCARERARYEGMLMERTGLCLDPYFSATKLRYLLREHGLMARARAGELAFGTVDTWLLWNLSGGRLHLTDVSNASRTLMMNLESLDWDERILDWLEIPRALLPRICGHDEVLGHTDPSLFGGAIPIAAVLGDQQAALFGQGCHAPGQAKNTYGTGCFLLVNTGERRVRSRRRLLSTVAWQRAGCTTFALEGSSFAAGAAVQWLIEELGVAASVEELNQLAHSVEDSGGLCLVPAFSGLGAPHWDPSARGLLGGLTRGTTKAHLCRAALEGLALQNRELIMAFNADLDKPIQSLRVDGGGASSDLLMQLQADLSELRIKRSAQRELTALGVAGLAGIVVGTWDRLECLEPWQGELEFFDPAMSTEERERLVGRWEKAVEASKGWN